MIAVKAAFFVPFPFQRRYEEGAAAMYIFYNSMMKVAILLIIITEQIKKFWFVANACVYYHLSTKGDLGH